MTIETSDIETIETDIKTKDIESIRTDFNFKISSLTISPDTIILVLQYAMEAVEASTLSGTEKKQAVMDLVKKAVTDAPIDNHVETVLLEMIDDGIISHTIDIIVSASRKELNLNSVGHASQILCSQFVPHLWNCFKSCYGQH